MIARHAALALFGKGAALLFELRPISGAQNAGTVRNRMPGAGQDVVQPHHVENARPLAVQASGLITVGFDGDLLETARPSPGGAA